MRLEWLSILIVTLTVSRNCWGKVSNCVTKNCFEKTRMISFFLFRRWYLGHYLKEKGKERKKVCFLGSVELIRTTERTTSADEDCEVWFISPWKADLDSGLITAVKHKHLDLSVSSACWPIQNAVLIEWISDDVFGT